MKTTFLPLLLAALHFVGCREAKVVPVKHPSVPPEERAISISEKPVFKQHEVGQTYQYVTLEAPEDRSITWPEAAPKPASLDANRTYRFDLLEEKLHFSGSDPSYWSPEIHKIFDGEKLLFDASVCEKHHTAMERKLVPISYGLPAFSKEQWKNMGKTAPTLESRSVVAARIRTVPKRICGSVPTV